MADDSEDEDHGSWAESLAAIVNCGISTAFADGTESGSRPPPVPPPAAAPAPVPPPAAAKPPARKLDFQLSTRSTALANALDDDESTKGMSAVQRRIKAIEDKMKGKK